MAEFRSLKRRAGVAEEGLLIDKERLEEPEQVVHALKRRIGIAEEMVRIKKERLDEADQEYEAEHRTFTIFSKRLEEKLEQRFDALEGLVRDAGVREEDITAVRMQPWRDASAQRSPVVERRAAAEREAEPGETEGEVAQDSGAVAAAEQLAHEAALTAVEEAQYVEIPAVQSQQQSPSVGNAKKKKVHIDAYTS
jgi:hypothetical protein